MQAHNPKIGLWNFEKKVGYSYLLFLQDDKIVFYLRELEKIILSPCIIFHFSL
jgi:hypothetical protein